MSIPFHIFSDAVHLGSFSSTADLVLTGGGTTANKIVFALLTTSASGGADATGCVINPGVDDIAMTRLTDHNMTRLGRPVSVWVFYDGLGGIPFPDGDILLHGTWANGSYRPQMEATLWGAADAVPPYSGDVSFVNPTNASSHSITVASNASNSKVVALAYCGGGLTITATAPTTLLDFSNTNGYAGLGVLTKEAAASVTLNWTTGSNDIVPRFGVSIDGTGAGAAITFTGTVPTINLTIGTADSVDLSTYFSGTETPFTYALDGASSALPSGVTLSSAGLLEWSGSGSAGTTTGVIVEGTDQTPDTADTNSFSIVIAAPAENPVITGQPSNATVKRGQTATFTVAATGSGTVTYQWQRNPGGVGSWADISGATSASYTTPATTISGGSANDQDDYRCQVSDDDAGPVASDTVTLTVNQATLALNAAGYEIGDGSSPATMAVDASVAWEIEVINDALPPVSVYHSDSVTTSAAGRLTDISDDDLIYGTTYTVLGRRVSDGEWFAFTIDAT